MQTGRGLALPNSLLLGSGTWVSCSPFPLSETRRLIKGSGAGSHVIPIPGSSHSSRVLENLASVNVNLDQDELNEINAILKLHQVHGDRYYGANINALTWG